MSETAYSTKREVETFFKGNDTVAGLGFEHFQWFEVRCHQHETFMFVKPIPATSLSLRASG